jgi:hypothetical protein
LRQEEEEEEEARLNCRLWNCTAPRHVLVLAVSTANPGYDYTLSVIAFVDDIEMENRNTQEQSLLQCQFVHHESHTD